MRSWGQEYNLRNANILVVGGAKHYRKGGRIAKKAGKPQNLVLWDLWEECIVRKRK